MKAKEFKNVILFMANRWNRSTAIEIFGENMGQHFWDKWIAALEDDYKGPDYATMILFYEMTEDYLQKLLDYIKTNYMG